MPLKPVNHTFEVEFSAVPRKARVEADQVGQAPG
jgi:hypothetical protein